MGALTIADLHVLQEEPRVRDLELGERLGFERVTDVRKLITRRLDELSTYGVCATVAQTPGRQGGRPTFAYLLNEEQALLVCLFARTPKAAEVRRQVIEVFMAYRRGQLAPVAITPAPPAVPVDAIAAELRRLSDRIEALDALGATVGAADFEAVGLALTHASIWSGARPGRRPAWFGDRQVRAHVIATHRQGRLDDVLNGMRERFGDRCPSRSSLHRFWQRLDELKRPRDLIGEAR